MATALGSGRGSKWLDEIHQQLDTRDRRQNHGFADLINFATQVSKTMRQLSSRADSLRLENDELKQQNDALQRAVAAGGRPGGASSREFEELKQQNAELTRRLLDATTRESNAHHKSAELSEQLRRKEDECKRHEENEIKYQDQAVGLGRQVRELQEKLRKEELANTVLHDELQALQLELVSREERAKELETENKRLLERWLRKINEEATKMNEANAAYEEMLLRQQKQQQQPPAAPSSAEPEVTPLAEDTMLDRLRLRSLPLGASIPTTLKKRIVPHEAEINAIHSSYNGNMFATGSGDRKVKIFDSQGNMKATIRGAQQGVMCVQFSKNDEMVLAGSNDNITRIWSVDSGRSRVCKDFTFTGHIGKVFAARFTGDSSRVISGSHDRTLKVWDLQRNYCVRTIFSYSSCNDLCLLDVGGSMLASGHLDNHVRFWDSRSGDCVNEVTGVHSGQITSLNIAPNHMELLTNSRDNTLKLIDVRMFHVVHTYSADSYKTGMNWAKSDFSPDGEYVVAGSSDGGIYIWNTRSARLEKTLRGHTYVQEHTGAELLITAS